MLVLEYNKTSRSHSLCQFYFILKGVNLSKKVSAKMSISGVLVLGVIGVILGAIGSVYATCFGGIPFKDYVINWYNKMWFSTIWKDKRFKWMKEHVVQNYQRLSLYEPGEKELIDAKTSFIIGKVLGTSDFKLLEQKHFEMAITSLKLANIKNILRFTLILQIIRDMKTSSISVAWELILIMIEYSDKPNIGENNAQFGEIYEDLYPAYHHLGKILNGNKESDKNFQIIEKLMLLLRSYLQDREQYPSPQFNDTVNKRIDHLV